MTGPALAGHPERIGRYRIVEAVGAGAFATVYRGVDERLDAPVAVKVLADNHSIDPAVRERFVQEGRLLRRVRSRHLLAVHDLGETDRAQPFLVLEWADRGDLGNRLAARHARGTAATPADALVLAEALAAALRALHAARVVHRDLTPRNLLLRSEPGITDDDEGACVFGGDEQLVVADLGLSKDLARASGLTLATGTSGFAAPEQREPGAQVDHRADLWAASALMVWLATGAVPDRDGRWRAQLVDASWPAEVASVLARGLDPSPEGRPDSIDEWCQGIGHALGPDATAVPRGAPVAAGSGPGDGVEDARPRSGDARRGSGRRRRGPGLRRCVVAAAAAVAVLLVGAAAGYTLAPADRDTSTVTETLPDGGARTVTDLHGMTVTIEGPTEVPVDETAGFSATVDGAASWAWVAPDGSMHPEAGRLDVVPVGPGRLTVRVVAADDQGRVAWADHDVRVVGS